MNALYEAHGVKLGPLAPATSEARNALPGEIVLAQALPGRQLGLPQARPSDSVIAAVFRATSMQR